MTSKNPLWLSSVYKWIRNNRLAMGDTLNYADHCWGLCGFCKKYRRKLSTHCYDCSKCPLLKENMCKERIDGSVVIFWEIRLYLGKTLDTQEKDKEWVEILTRCMLEAVLRNEF